MLKNEYLPFQWENNQCFNGLNVLQPIRRLSSTSKTLLYDVLPAVDVINMIELPNRIYHYLLQLGLLSHLNLPLMFIEIPNEITPSSKNMDFALKID